jgi:nitrous oxidase accessory protein NosD
VCAAYPSNGSEGAFAPSGALVVIAGGVHHFTTITIPAGTTVQMQPDDVRVLDLRATGAVVVDGVIDVSGGPRSTGTAMPSMGVDSRQGGNGGNTGSPA